MDYWLESGLCGPDLIGLDTQQTNIILRCGEFTDQLISDSFAKTCTIIQGACG